MQNLPSNSIWNLNLLIIQTLGPCKWSLRSLTILEESLFLGNQRKQEGLALLITEISFYLIGLYTIFIFCYILISYHLRYLTFVSFLFIFPFLSFFLKQIYIKNQNKKSSQNPVPNYSNETYWHGNDIYAFRMICFVWRFLCEEQQWCVWIGGTDQFTTFLIFSCCSSMRRIWSQLCLFTAHCFY